MPRHIHGIIALNDKEGGINPPLPNVTHCQRSFVDSRPSHHVASTRSITRLAYPYGNATIYYEHVIRNEDEIDLIRQYILGNPMKWLEDEENPQNIHEVRS
jgi:putative transposase